MIIERLALRYGDDAAMVAFDHDYLTGANIAYHDGVNAMSSAAMITAILAFTGADACTEWFAGTDVRWFLITVSHEDRTWTFEHRDGVVTAEMIDDFKGALPHRTGFVTAHENLVPERRDPATSLTAIRAFLATISLRFDHQFVYRPGVGADYLVTGGAQKEFIRQGFQFTPPNVPMVLDAPEHNVHMSVRPWLDRFYDADHQRQIFVRTNCRRSAKAFKRARTSKIVFAPKVALDDIDERWHPIV